MKLKIISFCLLFVVIFISCKKEPPLNVENSGALLLSKVLIDNQPYNEYSYNSANLIIEEKSNFDFKMHHYNARNQVVSTDYYGNNDILNSDPNVFQTALSRDVMVTPDNGSKEGTFNYEYNDNEQLIKSTYSRTSFVNSEYSEFSYDVNNRISTQTLYWNNKETGYIDYTFDGKGNLIKENLYNLSATGVAELSTTTQYEFDNKQNPYQSFSKLMTPGINTNKNNIIKETYTIHLTANLGGDNVQVTQTSYTYNSKGYPITKNGNVEYVY